jgi:glycine betaine/proline transport system substrate-binding protein
MKMQKIRPLALLAMWAVMLVLVLGACGGQTGQPVEEPAAEEPAEEPVTEPTEATAEEPAGEEITITLAENPWSASAINVNVAKILLEEQLGYPVEIVTIDENGQWPAIASGDLHASLEVWPSGHGTNVTQYIDEQGTVENAGLIGPVGKIGWYVPSYVVEQHPELATWEGFTSAETAALFATAETGENGQFLAGDPSFVQYDADIINNLGLPFQVVVAGSEEAILAALDSAVSREEPLLFYFWTPHSIHAKYELTEVQLPEYSEECYAEADSGGVACDYPPDELFKIIWPGLADAAPDAYQFLQNMSYTTEDQISMIAAVELDGKSAEEAAREWIDTNEATWSAWLP